MLQSRFAGAAPEVGECHFAFPSDCFPWASPDGMFVIGEGAPEDEREETCQARARETRALEVAFVRGDRSARARWIPGCPASVSLGGVGGNRWLVMTPEPTSWDLCLWAPENRRNVKRVSLANVDKLKSPAESLPRRPKQPSAGGDCSVLVEVGGET